MTDCWDHEFLMRSPMFEPLRGVGTGLARHCQDWPGLDAYQSLLQEAAMPVHTVKGVPIRFVPQAVKPAAFSEKYEPRIFLSGEVQTRTGNWHDLFNALVWAAFPATKAAINARHYRALEKNENATGTNRGRERDAATLFDESGVVVTCAVPLLGKLLREHQWKELFWNRRQAVMSGMKFFLFGHSLYEKALHPYVGMTGKGLLLEVDDIFFTQPQAVQLAQIDARTAGFFSDTQTIDAGRNFFPVPLLGVPGWSPDNEREAYYENTAYFRPRRSNILLS